MMLILLILMAVFRPLTCCWDDLDSNYNYIKFITVEEGDSLKLACYDSGDPHLPIKWYREPTRRNFTLPNGELRCECGNVLEFPSITKNQRGRYFCNIDSIPLSTSRYIKVNVNFIPTILETRRIDNLGSKELELGCNIEAYPPPEILWTKNNIILYTNKQHRVMTNYDCNDVYNSTLIVSTESNYYGIYTCRIMNKVGQLVMTFVVTTPTVKTNLPSAYDGSKGP
ncbi:lachesin-like isoform X2 [Chelonus insularis]|uniref:lachesin-like isoform X2 n=1 Tax=Chelonus insularis TaxID=460826 RepID=UPI00158AE0EC|nr:lachesin-like isoform X2 [Chelonus insularis]